MSEKLKPCPFCGEERTLIHSRKPIQRRCSNCGAEGPEGTAMGSADILWNNRNHDGGDDMRVFSDTKMDEFDFISGGRMEGSIVMHKHTGLMCLVMSIHGTGSFKEGERRFVIPGIIEMKDPWNKRDTK